MKTKKEFNLYFDLVVKQIAVNKEAQEYTNKLRENCLNVLEKLLYVVEQQWRVFKECQNSIYDARDKYADKIKSKDHKLAGKINIGIDFRNHLSVLNMLHFMRFALCRKRAAQSVGHSATLFGNFAIRQLTNPQNFHLATMPIGK